ncbi:MAG: porin family protein [Bacteroidales bacterium]|nr:porin family protein [Bacteroidales bacterium]
MKRILLLLIFSLAVLSAIAQQKVPREWDFGVVGGTNMSTYNFYPKVTQKMGSGMTAGVAVRYIEEKFFGIEAELLYTQRTMTDEYDEDHPDYKFSRTLSYIELPVQAHIYFNLGKKSEIAVDLGPKIGVYLSDKISSNLDESFYEEYAWRFPHGYQHHLMDVSKKFDYGIQAGLGYEFKFNRQYSFQLTGRYYFGLGNIFPDSKKDTYEQSGNRSVQIVGTFWFHHRVKVRHQ